MSAKKIPVISIVSLDFDRIAQLSDKEVYEHLVMVCRLSKKRIIPAKVHCNAFRVSRAANSVTIHLLFSEKESARVSFVQAPRFNIM